MKFRTFLWLSSFSEHTWLQFWILQSLMFHHYQHQTSAYTFWSFSPGRFISNVAWKISSNAPSWYQFETVCRDIYTRVLTPWKVGNMKLNEWSINILTVELMLPLSSMSTFLNTWCRSLSDITSFSRTLRRLHPAPRKSPIMYYKYFSSNQ